MNNMQLVPDNIDVTVKLETEEMLKLGAILMVAIVFAGVFTHAITKRLL